MSSTKFRRGALMGVSALAVAFFVALPGQAFAQSIELGMNPGDDDSLVVGAGETVIAPTVDVGVHGRGTLTIQDGGTVTSPNIVYVASYPGSAGIINVTGPGSTLTTGGNLHIGAYGNGTINVSNGGSVFVQDGFQVGGFGGPGPGTGTATVTGMGSSVESNHSIDVGYEGQGSLTVSDGATVTSRKEFWIGGTQAGQGSLTVTGAGSSINVGTEFFVGNLGHGDLTVSAGGAVTSGGEFAIGKEATGVGTATVTGTGSSVTAGLIEIGYGGQGSLTVSDGATVTSHSLFWIGDTQAGQGSLTVTGAGSSINVAGHLYVGNSGRGDLTVSAGGAVTMGGHAEIGHEATGTGTVTVTGTGSSLHSNGYLNVGAAGSGTLNVSDGGTVSSYLANVGELAGSNGLLTVTGAGSTLTTPMRVIVGYDGNGTLIVSNGGTVQATAHLADIMFGAGGTGVGTAIVTGAGSSLTTGILTIGYDGHGSLTVSDGATVGGPIAVGLAINQNSTGTLSIGGQSGSAATAAGNVNGTINFGAGNGVLVFNHNTAGYSFGNDLVSLSPGNGGIRFEAGSTTLSGNSTTFTGTSDVLNGATLTLNGGLGGVLNVNAGGLLNATSATFGTLNLNGTLNIGTGGTLTGTSASFNAGSLTIVDPFTGANPVTLSGTATIANGATLRVAALNGPATAGARYNVLTAAGGLTGRFTLEGGARPLSAFLSLRDGYSATQAYVEIALTRDFAAAGQTPNQRASAAGLQSVGAASPLFNAVANMPNDASAQTAFDALSGEIHPGARSVLARDTYRVQQVVLANGITGDREAAGRVWASAWANDGHLTGNGNAARLDHDSLGILIGADVHVGGGWRFGAAVGYDEGNVESLRGDGRADITRKHLLAYFDGDLGGLTLRGGVGYTEAGIKTARTAAFTSPALNVNQRLSGDYDGSVVHGYLDASYGFAVGGGAEIAPFANVSVVSAQTQAFTETGGTAALGVAKATNDLTFSTAGVRVNRVSIGTFDLSGSAGWRHAFGDLDAAGVHNLSGGSRFTVLTTDTGRDAAVLDLNLDWRPSDTFSVGAGVGLATGAGMNDRRATVSVRYRF